MRGVPQRRQEAKKKINHIVVIKCGLNAFFAKIYKLFSILLQLILSQVPWHSQMLRKEALSMGAEKEQYLCKEELENSPKNKERRGFGPDFQNSIQYLDSFDPEWYGFRSDPMSWELHMMNFVWNVSVPYTSGCSLIQANTNDKIHHGRQGQRRKE